MNDERESGAAAERTIRRLLVRYGRSGNVAWFGTVHDLPTERGDAVVVLTALGEWSGIVLRGDAPSGGSPSPLGRSDSPQDAAPKSPPPLSGELLRRLSDSDRQGIAAAHHRSSELAERARQEISQEAAAAQGIGPGAPRPAPAVTVIDAEVSLCGRFGIVWFAGRGSAALGPAATRLAAAFGLERVQWLALESPVAAIEESIDTAAAESQLAAAPAHQQPAFQQAGLNQTAQAQPIAGAAMALRALCATESGELGRVARQAREPLGMLGAYSQKIRDEPSVEKRSQTASPRRRWMLRMRATAGGVTVGQLEQLALLAMRYGDGSLRLTMRQGLQMHGVVPGSGGEVLRAIESLAMTTRGSCGNVFRNVTCCPHSPRSPAALAARQLAATVTQQWLPRAEWLSWVIDAEGHGDSAAEFEAENSDRLELDAAYPQGYLPHKWKLGVATAEDNCIDVLTNDVGLIVRCEGSSERASVDCYVGGSLAYRPGVTGSVAMLAEPLGRVAMADVSEVLRSLTEVHRQVSTAGSRHWRRLKYLVRRVGVRELTERIEHAVGRSGILSPITGEPLPARSGHPPWTLQMDGLWTRTIEVVGGRLRFGDDQPASQHEANQHKGAEWLRLCRFGRGMRIGPRHSLVIDGIEAKHKAAVDALIAGPLAEYAAEPSGAESSTEPGSPPRTPRVLACVALPTCPLAVAEAERTAAEWRRALEPVVGDLAHIAATGNHRDVTVAISGCTNGCSHPLTSTVGIVAESPGRFRIFAGGDGRSLGVSLGTVAGPMELAALVRTAAERFRQGREDCEGFIDWWSRDRNRET